jgi:hypothetical protein
MHAEAREARADAGCDARKLDAATEFFVTNVVQANDSGLDFDMAGAAKEFLADAGLPFTRRSARKPDSSRAKFMRRIEAQLANK